MANKHFIGRQFFELRVQSSEGVYDLQQQVGNLFRGHLVPAMVDLFDRIAGGDEVIRIDRVELNLGRIGVKEIRAEEFVQRIITHLEKECLSYQRLSVQGGNEADERDGTSNLKPLSAHVFDLWLHWLEKGTLPPYALQPEEKWMDEVLKTLGVDLHAVTRLRDILMRSPSAFRRLVLQHKAGDLKSITELYTGHTQTELLRLFDELKEIFHRQKVSAISYRQLETEMWTLVFHRVILEGKKMDTRSLGDEMIKHPALIGITRQLVKETEADSADFPMLQELFRSVITELRGARESEPGSVYLSEAAALQEDRGLESPQFFTNAGVVLLHPFLKRFFEKLKLLDGSLFKNHDSRCKAVLLMQFMATGEEIASEYDLILLKFLCGMPVNLPLDHTLELTRKEKQEAENVLHSAITHWNVLGSTSPDGLREGFLVRDGKLEKEQSGWKLHVEQKTMDVLLERLPWTMSIIKLPWMKEMLKVEWR